MKKVVMRNDHLLPEVARLVAEGESVNIKTKGCSMLPFIHGGKDSVVLVKAEDVKPMDIVLAEVSEGMFVLHRVMEIKDGYVVLMGDGNIRGRERCRKDKVLAKAVSIEKDGKSVDCCSRGHIFKARVWRFLLPLRRYLLAIYRRLFK